MMNEQNKPEQNKHESGDNEARCAWTDPVISRIEIKRTMAMFGSINDGLDGSI